MRPVQFVHIQSPDLKFSDSARGGLRRSRALCSPPDLRCLHLKHADLEAKLRARQPVQIQSPGRKLPAVGPPAGSDDLETSPEKPPPPPEPPALAFLHLEAHAARRKVVSVAPGQVQSPGRRTPPPPPAEAAAEDPPPEPPAEAAAAEDPPSPEATTAAAEEGAWRMPSQANTRQRYGGSAAASWLTGSRWSANAATRVRPGVDLFLLDALA